jgi:hypothetical protein
VVKDVAANKSWSYASNRVGVIEFQGGNGNDRFVSNVPGVPVRAFGNAGNDYLAGNSARDTLEGGAGDDTLYGLAGDDQLLGRDGNDRLYGGDGNDTVWGGNGNDILLGMAGNDQLVGDAGDDRLNGGAGQDSLWGGNGNDVLITIDGGTSDFAQGDAGSDIIWADQNGTSKDSTSGVTLTDKVQYIRSFANGADRTLDGDRIADPAVLSGHTLKRFANNPLFSSSGPAPADIRQGAIGDCYLLAGLAAIALDNPQAIRQNIVDFDDGTYGVRLGDSFYRVDDDLPVVNQISTSPDYAGLGRENSMWVAVYEKAFAHYRKGTNSFDSIQGGFGDEVNKAFGSTATGRKQFWEFIPGGGAAALANEIYKHWSGKESVTIGTGRFFGVPSELEPAHAYTVMSVTRTSVGKVTSIRLRNPWGREVTVTPDQLYSMWLPVIGGALSWGKV